MTTIDWNSVGADDFRRVADELQDTTIAHADDLFALVERADPQKLLSLLTQYRFFTIYYIPDLAILIARLRDGKLRSFLGSILSDELGHGDPAKAHPRLYDDFLRTIGAERDLDGLALKENVVLLDAVRGKLLDPRRSTAYGVGLRGMGGECVCQIYLTKLYERLLRNPHVEAMRPRVDWRFWDLHAGEHDREHRHETRHQIHGELVLPSDEARADLGRGYLESMVAWRRFWTNIFESVKSDAPERVKVQRSATFRGAAADGGAGA